MRVVPVLLGGLAAFVAFGAIPAGILLIASPSGAAIGLPIAVLEGTPFPDFALPGALLAIVVGGTQVAAAVAAWAAPRRAGLLAAAAGAVLVGWIAVQVGLIGLISALQPVMLGCGILEIVLGAVAARAPVRGVGARPPIKPDGREVRR